MELTKITCIIYFAWEICILINISWKKSAKTTGNRFFSPKNVWKCSIIEWSIDHGHDQSKKRYWSNIQ